jgi:hypothetical protein
MPEASGMRSIEGTLSEPPVARPASSRPTALFPVVGCRTRRSAGRGDDGVTAIARLATSAGLIRCAGTSSLRYLLFVGFSVSRVLWSFISFT